MGAFNPAVALQSLIDHMHQVSVRKGYNLQVFQNTLLPKYGDPVVIKRVNHQLLEDPETQIPEGYRPYTTKDLEF